MKNDENNTQGRDQNSTCMNDPISSRYLLLARLAELDLELAKSATAAGMAADLLFPAETPGFTSVVSAKTNTAE
jgi:hypothetical protein